MAVVMLGSWHSGKFVSKVRPNLNPISEESMQTWIQKSPVRQPLKCKMLPSCMLCCRWDRSCAWTGRVAFVLASEPSQHCLMVGPGGCTNSGLNCWILSGLLVRASCWRYLPVSVYFTLLCSATLYIWLSLLLSNLKHLLIWYKINGTKWCWDEELECNPCSFYQWIVHVNSISNIMQQH